MEQKIPGSQKLERHFKIAERKSTIKTEILAGLTTFFAMSYIVVTNPDQVVGFNSGGAYDTIWNAVYVASVLVAVLGTALYALYANLPYAQACSMGLNSFFFVSFILPNAVDPILGYQEGLAVILMSGVLFLIFSVTGARKYIAKALPDCLKKAIPAGIGLFIAMIGFKNATIIQDNPYTFVQLFDFHGALQAAEGFMDGWKAIAPAALAILGLVMITVLEKKQVKGSIILSILSVTVLYYVTTWTLPTMDFNQIGQSFRDFGEIGIFGAFKGFKTAFADSQKILNAAVLVITFCLVDMFDTVGTLYGTAAQAGMLDENGDPIDMDKAMNCDSIATAGGAVLGTSTCTTFVESASGVAVGGRTGFASLVTTGCFALCLFLTPLAAVIPACATAPALIYVGVLMMKSFSNVDLTDIASAVPAFLAMFLMPLTYSISNGIAVGAIAYVLITLITGKYTKKDLIVTGIAVVFILRFFFISY